MRRSSVASSRSTASARSRKLWERVALPPSMHQNLIGRKTKRAVSSGMLFTSEMFDNRPAGDSAKVPLYHRGWIERVRSNQVVIDAIDLDCRRS